MSLELTDRPAPAPIETKSDAPPPKQRRARRSASDKLKAALLALADHKAQILDHHERPWASITFSGARHTLTLYFAGPDAVEAGETFIAELPEHEFKIPGQLVADATVTEAEHRLHPAPRLVVHCEVLLLQEA